MFLDHFWVYNAILGHFGLFWDFQRWPVKNSGSCWTFASPNPRGGGAVLTTAPGTHLPLSTILIILDETHENEILVYKKNPQVNPKREHRGTLLIGAPSCPNAICFPPQQMILSVFFPLALNKRKRLCPPHTQQAFFFCLNRSVKKRKNFPSPLGLISQKKDAKQLVSTEVLPNIRSGSSETARPSVSGPAPDTQA